MTGKKKKAAITGSCFDRLNTALPDLTKSQRRVADYILKNPIQSAFSTVEEIARAVNTSTTTVMRLAVALGYTGFTEYQKIWQSYLKDKSTPSIRLELSGNAGTSGAEPRTGGSTARPSSEDQKNNIIDKVSSVNFQNLAKTIDGLSYEAVMEVCRRINSAEHIYVYGIRSCYGPAHYLSYNLDRVLGNCDFAQRANTEIAECIRRINKKDVVIIFSLPRYVRNIVLFSKEAKKRGAFVIAVTDSYTSPYSGIADVIFCAESVSSDFHNSILAMVFIVEVLISTVVDIDRGRTSKNLKAMENILDELAVHMK
jgi:DNA-binding MurR/RpiR family transcriptional regulator